METKEGDHSNVTSVLGNTSGGDGGSLLQMFASNMMRVLKGEYGGGVASQEHPTRYNLYFLKYNVQFHFSLSQVLDLFKLQVSSIVFYSCVPIVFLNLHS